MLHILGSAPEGAEVMTNVLVLHDTRQVFLSASVCIHDIWREVYFKTKETRDSQVGQCINRLALNSFRQLGRICVLTDAVCRE